MRLGTVPVRAVVAKDRALVRRTAMGSEEKKEEEGRRRRKDKEEEEGKATKPQRATNGDITVKKGDHQRWGRGRSTNGKRRQRGEVGNKRVHKKPSKPLFKGKSLPPRPVAPEMVAFEHPHPVGHSP